MIYDIQQQDIEVYNSCLLCDKNRMELLSDVCNHNDVVFLGTSYCMLCGFVFRSTRPTMHWFSDAWKKRQLYEHKNIQLQLTANEKTEQLRYERYTNLEQVLTVISINEKLHKRVLDIGCGPGAGLRAFVDNAWEVVGLEPDPLRAEYGQNEYNLDIKPTYIENFKSQKLFNFVTIIQVLEHIHKPKEFLFSAVENLAINGFLYVEVPDLLSNFVDIKDSWYLEHMNNFTIKTLTEIGISAGLTPRMFFHTKTSPLSSQHIAILFEKCDKDDEIDSNMYMNLFNLKENCDGQFVYSFKPNMTEFSLTPSFVKTVRSQYRRINTDFIKHEAVLHFRVNGISNITNVCEVDNINIKDNIFNLTNDLSN